MTVVAIDRLTLVFNADSGVRNGLADMAKKLLGRSECSLCDATYGVATEKEEWKACKVSLGFPIVQIYRDEVPEEMDVVIAGRYPCAVVTTAGTHRLLLDAEAIACCDGDAERLRALISEEIARMGAANTNANQLTT